MTAHIIGNQANFVGHLNLRFEHRLVPVILVLRERITMEKNCLDCGKLIRYSPLTAFDPVNLPITESGLCSNGIDGCWENKKGQQ